MRRLLLLVFAVVVCAPAASAQVSSDHSKEAFIIEQMRTSFRFESDGTGRREVYLRVKVQSEAGVQQWGQVVLGYNAANERIEIPFVRVRKGDGAIVQTPPES